MDKKRAASVESEGVEKKQKLDEADTPETNISPTTKKLTIKVVPLKGPLDGDDVDTPMIEEDLATTKENVKEVEIDDQKEKEPEPLEVKVEKKETIREIMLGKMDLDRKSVLELINSAVMTINQGENIIVNDSRLSIQNHPNKDLFLGHVIYTGAKEASSENDLVLFLCPEFTANDHFATIQVRIPSELLLFSSNSAVRKAAVWGTDIYTDDSDVVASN